MTLTLRYMRLPDIPAVVAIDRVSFDPAWSARSYSYEVGESTYSHMLVLEQTEEEKPKQGWRRLVPNLSANGGDSEGTIVGYGGLWHIMDESHISTIATHPDFRGRGWGEILLAAMIRRSITLKAAYIVLEVRVSNSVAQNLYRKYQFETIAVKKRYYHNNGEDAYDMRLNLENNSEYLGWFENRYQELVTQYQFTDLYSRTPHPHKQR
ncbi:MAG TPA: ribosomal protein S18-alanine N-acetyltransferase [Oceanobacillus sp.]|nr:ribosomal protein S18-alanine N-acetyltransferase [Oceanobacillus sp.]